MSGTSPTVGAKISTIALAVVAVAVLLKALGGVGPAGLVADAALAVYAAVEAAKLPRPCLVMVGLAGVAALVVAATVPGGAAIMLDGFGRATLVAALLAALGFINEAARTSPLIRECGMALIEQPSRRRYLIMTLGAHLFALVLGVGVLNLLGTMVMRANQAMRAGQATPDAVAARLRLRELTLGLMRGFCTMPMWSPLSIGLAVVLTMVPGVTWEHLLPVAAAVTVSFLALGWLLDGLKLVPAFSGGATRSEDDAPLNWRPMARFAALALLIVGGAVSFTVLTDVRLNEGVMITTPIIAIGWLTAQYARFGLGEAVSFTFARLRRRSFAMFPGYRVEICLIGSGAVMGGAVGALLPTGVLGDAIQSMGQHPILLAGLLMLFIMIGAQTGMGAVVGVTVVASAIPDPAALHLTPLMLAVTFLCSWALSSGSAVYGTTLVILSRLTAEPGAAVAFRWNGPFTALGFLLSLGWLLALAEIG